MDTTICPICKHELDSCPPFKSIVKTFSSMMTPFGFAKAMYHVGKTIYYDFTDLLQTDECSWCPNCQNYILICPHCKHNFSVGTDSPLTGTKHKCTFCNTIFVYATHPDPDINHAEFL